jgi:DNA-binding MarR family transcriptional regulator
MERTNIDVLSSQLERSLTVLNRLLRAATQADLSVAALLTLRRLEVGGPLRITELAWAEAVSQPTMTGLVARLEQEGLVLRSPDAEDARAVRVSLTRPGRTRLDRVRKGRAAVLRARLDSLDDDDLAALAAALPALDQLIASESRS